MLNQFSRTELLIGKEAVKKLQNSKVAIFGVGGVGSYVVESLARAGIGHLILVDFETIDITNINRQIHALHSSIGNFKVEVMKQRILDINPNIFVETFNTNDIKNNEETLINKNLTYVVDAIDTITNKIKLIEKATSENVKIISATSTGNKLEPTMFEVSDIYKTSICPICRILRKELKNRGIKKLKVVYSKEIPIKQENNELNDTKSLGSISFVPSVVGLIIASEVVKDIIKDS